jgi:hypothetical protein
MKKDKTKLPRRRSDGKPAPSRKPGDAHPPQPAGDGLTCNEAQVEDLLAEGEST